MAERDKKRKTQIPEKAIQGPAGINDSVKFTAYSMEPRCEITVENPNKKNTTTKIVDSKEPKEVYSVDLGLGMKIPAKPGGRETTQRDNAGEAR